LQDTNSTCDFTANAGSPTCGSDIRLKKDITLVGDRVLSKLTALDVVTYHWNTDTASASLQTGFIAQNVQEFFPSLVASASWIDGAPALFLSQNGLIPYLVKGIQELASKDLMLDELLQPTTDNPQSTTESGPLARLVQNILAYIANAFGFIVEKGRIQADTVQSNNLCAGTVCVNEEQLQQLLRQTNNGQPTTNGQQPTPTPLPSISIEPIVASDSVTIATPTPPPTSTEEPPPVVEVLPSATPAP
jgi:hypothetical protein